MPISRIAREFKRSRARRLAVALLLVFSLFPFVSSPAAAESISDYFSYSYTVQFSKPEVGIGETFYANAQASGTCIKTLPIKPTEVATTARIVATHQASGTKVTLNPGYTVTLSPFPTEVGQSAQVTQTLELQFPAGSQYGAYSVAAELTGVSINIGIAWVPLPSYFMTLLPSSQTIGSLNLSSSPGSSGGGGGGGGGAQPTTAPVTPSGITSVVNAIDQIGKFTQDVTAGGLDGKVMVIVAKNTTGLDITGRPLTQITVSQAKEPPAASANSRAVGLAYDWGPAGATFDPPIVLTLKYDDDQLPTGASENSLAAATWDPVKNEWSYLASTVDPAANTVTTKTGHFSIFSLMARTRPANISLGNLTITPAEAATGQNVTISCTIANSGDLSGTYKAVLIVDNSTVDTKDIAVAGGGTQTATFITSRSAAGSFSVSIGNLSGTLVVKASKPTSTTSPLPSSSTAASPNPTQPAPSPSPAASQSPTTLAPTTPPVPPTSTVDWSLILSLGAGGAILGFAVWFLIRRQGTR